MASHPLALIKRAPRFTVLLLGVLLCGIEIFALYQARQQNLAASSALASQWPSVQVKQEVGARWDRASVDRLRASSLMGVPPKPVNLTELPATTLQLRLVGVFTNTGGQPASALISQNAQLAKRFVEGQEIAPGVVLEQIHPQTAVIRRQGELETLSFVKKAIGAAPLKRRPAPAMVLQPINTEPPMPTPSTMIHRSSPIEPESAESMRAKLQSHVEQLRTAPSPRHP